MELNLQPIELEGVSKQVLVVPKQKSKLSQLLPNWPIKVSRFSVPEYGNHVPNPEVSKVSVWMVLHG